MDNETRANMFRALGDPTRVQIFEFLRGCCGEVAVEESGDVRPVNGATVGEVCCRITGDERITSTLSYHLKELRIAGLVEVEKRGRNIVCRANRQAATELAAWLDEKSGCCE